MEFLEENMPLFFAEKSVHIDFFLNRIGNQFLIK